MSSLVSPKQRLLARHGNAILRYVDLRPATLTDFKKDKSVIFIHGYTADSSYMKDLMHQFHGANFSCFAYDYECFDGIDKAAKTLYELLDILNINNNISDQRLVLIGHSMGGLVARAFIALEGGERFARKVITLGTPNNGTLKNARMLRYMAQLGEVIGGANPRGFSPKATSAMQLLGNDSPSQLIDKINNFSTMKVEFFSISGGYEQLEFGTGFVKNLFINRYLQMHLTSPNDGLIQESSCDISKMTSKNPTMQCNHINNYSEYSSTNHTHLVNNQLVALTAIRCAN